MIDAGGDHSCAVLATGQVRCWGFGANGALGYASTNTIGDNETPASVGPVDLGTGRTATAIGAGGLHTCALLDGGQVRCWGSPFSGQLGYGNTTVIGDDEAPGSVGPVDIGTGRTATAISAGAAHTCVLLDTAQVRCWGNGASGRLGYADTTTIGTTTPPGNVGPVDLGPNRTATAITAGDENTCALLDTGQVRCWGSSFYGQLGYAATTDVGDNETPGSVGPVDLRAGRTAKAISAGGAHTCALLDTGQVRCWGFGANGRLGYANTTTIGDTETPGSVGPVDLGAGRTATAISAGADHTCALLDTGQVRCWGWGANGRLGYANGTTIGDNETPGSVGPVDLGAGRTAKAISAGGAHTCALLDTGQVRCWGLGAFGQLGYANADTIGDNEVPGSVGPIELGGLVATAPPTPPPPPPPPPAPPPPPPPPAIAPKPLTAGALTLRARSRAGTITASGTLGLSPGARCEGRVTVTVRRGSRRVASKRTTLRTRSGACRYSAKLRIRKVPRGTRLRVRARFAGTSALAPCSSATRTVRR